MMAVVAEGVGPVLSVLSQCLYLNELASQCCSAGCLAQWSPCTQNLYLLQLQK